ncbi:MAG: hypothetical protein AAF449_00485 [Myxococcota bacterium]
MTVTGAHLFSATLASVARLEAAGDKPVRLTEPEFAKWHRFRRKLGWADFIRLLHEDLAEAFPEPFDVSRWGFDPFGGLEEATAEMLVKDAATPSDADKLDFLRDRARDLGLAAGGAIADLPKVQARFKVLELPGSGGRIAAYQCAQHGLAYDKSFTFAALSPAERVAVGLGAVELRANPPTILGAEQLQALADKKTRFDCVYGLKAAQDADTWADRFDAELTRLV